MGTWLLKAQCSKTALCWKKKETTRLPRSSCLKTTSSTRLSTLASSRLRQELKFLRKPLGKQLNGNAQLKNPQLRRKVGFTRARTRVLYVCLEAATLPLTSLTLTRRPIWANYPTWTFQSQYWALSQSLSTLRTTSGWSGTHQKEYLRTLLIGRIVTSYWPSLEGILKSTQARLCPWSLSFFKLFD